MTRRWLLIMVAVVSLCFFAISLGYAGITNMKGWSYESVYFDGVTGHEGTVNGIDINGEVGHPVSIQGPAANCSDGEWTGNISITSGSLPPGLTMSEVAGTYGNITGIPTERGHWIVEMHESNITCGGGSYMGFTQQLRSHITGTGKVVE